MTDTMSEPKISVVLPTYNGASYIRESIESILSQTCGDWELIIVNDSSTDGTLGIAEEYAARDGRITVRSNPENMKLPRSLNAGFALAKGKYLTWTSDDNRYKPEALTVMSSYLDEHPECGLVYCDMDIMGEDGGPGKAIPMPGPERLVYENTVGACFMYTRAAMEAAGCYDAGMFLAEDYDYWMSIYKQFPVAHLGRSLYEYRRHGKSLTGTRMRDIMIQTARLKAKHLDFILGKLDSPRDIRKLFDQLKDAGIIPDRGCSSAFAKAGPFLAARWLLRRVYLRALVACKLIALSP